MNPEAPQFIPPEVLDEPINPDRRRLLKKAGWFALGVAALSAGFSNAEKNKSTEHDPILSNTIKQSIEDYCELLFTQISENEIDKEEQLRFLEQHLVHLAQKISFDKGTVDGIRKGGRERISAIENACKKVCGEMMGRDANNVAYFVPDRVLGYYIVAGQIMKDGQERPMQYKKTPSNDRTKFVASMMYSSGDNDLRGQVQERFLDKPYTQVFLVNTPKYSFMEGGVIDVNQNSNQRIAFVNVKPGNLSNLEAIAANEEGNVIGRNMADALAFRDGIHDEKVLYQKQFAWRDKPYELLAIQEMLSNLIEIKHLLDRGNERAIRDTLTTRLSAHEAMASHGLRGYALIADMELESLRKFGDVSKIPITALRTFYFGGTHVDQSGYYKIQGGLAEELSDALQNEID